jgi:ubiquinone/menaquinone biosynthesis C-methylase UbiE
MSTQPFNPIEYKSGQRQVWDQVAAGWKKWWPTLEQALQQVSDRLADLAEIRPGDRVLDVGTGIGEPAVTVARRVGPKGNVVATDQSSQMLAIGRERAAALGLQNLKFQETDSEALDFSESSFDAVLSRFSLMFLPDLAAVLSRIRHMLVPDGTFAAAVWDAAPRVPLASLGLSLAQQMFELPAPLPGTPSVFGLAEGRLERALAQAGFTQVRAEPVEVGFVFDSVAAFIEYAKDLSAPLLAVLANQPAERQMEYWQRLAVAAQRYAAKDGSLRLPNTAICAVGRR